MENRAEQFSRGTIKSGGTSGRWRHSMNQKVSKGMRERQGKGLHPMDKAVEAMSRRERIELSQREFEEKALALEDQQRGLELLGERRQFQLDRALGNTFNGRPLEDTIDLAPENIAYVLEHVGEHEREIETFYTKKGTKVSITIVDFTRSVV